MKIMHPVPTKGKMVCKVMGLLMFTLQHTIVSHEPLLLLALYSV